MIQTSHTKNFYTLRQRLFQHRAVHLAAGFALSALVVAFLRVPFDPPPHAAHFDPVAILGVLVYVLLVMVFTGFKIALVVGWTVWALTSAWGAFHRYVHFPGWVRTRQDDL